MKSRIGYKLVIALLLFSSLITLIITALQLYLDYRTDMKRVKSYEVLIKESYLKSITTSVWLYDDKQIQTQLLGILHLPDMEHVQIHSDEGMDWSAGTVSSKKQLIKKFPLLYEHKGNLINIGALTAVVSLDNIYTSLFKKAFTILLSNAIKTFLVSGFILLFFQYLITRHLYSFSSWLKNLDIGRSFEKFHLDRSESKNGKTDELDEIVLATNEMQSKLKKYLSDIIENEEKFKYVFDNSAIGKSLTFLSGEMHTNKAFNKMLGYTKEEFQAIKWQEITHTDDIELSRQAIDSLLTGKNDSTRFIKRYLHKNGAVVWAEVSTALRRDKENKPLYFISSINDITNRKLTEEALRKSESKYKRLSENSPAVVYQFKMTPDGEFTFPYISDAVESIMGIAAQELLQNPSKLLGMIPLAEQKVFLDDVLKSAKSLDLYHSVVRYLRGGEERWVEAQSTPELQEDGSVLWDGFMVDITEKKKAEKEKEILEVQLQQSQKMESIGNLAGGIAHDFNNLLFPILGMSELLLEDLPAGSMEHENAQEIFEAGKRASELVKQILAFSRQDEQKMKPVRVQQVLKEVLKLSRSTIPADISISQHIQDNCGLVMADPTQIHQIAMNLITNAYHAVESSTGKIDVRVEEITLQEDVVSGALKSGTYILLTVSDNGLGIPQDIIHKIFEPYYTTKEKGKGTGLGLAVVYGIIKEYKGDIRAYSEAGKGTTFKVYLPLMKKNSNTEHIDKAEVLQNGTERILLVDDEVSVAKLEKQILERLGYKVTERVSSVDALSAFKENPFAFDLVITDMTMPNMTGDQLAKELISIRPDIPVVICTGFSERINKEKAESFGINGFLMKPVVKLEMAQMVRKVLDETRKSDN